MLEFRDQGQRTRVSLGHKDRQKAREQAKAAAAELAQAEVPRPVEKPEELTLGQLFDIYGEEVTPTKGAHSQKHDRRASEMLAQKHLWSV